MAIDWSSEDFARLYKRDTDDDLLLSWEAEAVWHKFLKKSDKSGLIETRRGLRGLAAVLRIPLEVIDRVMPELLEDGRLEQQERGFAAPNYLNANYVAVSTKARQAKSRLVKRVTGRDIDPDVSDSNQEGEAINRSRDVTTCHAESQFHQPINQSDQPPTRRAIPSDWQPREREVAMARDLGLDPEAEAQEFLAYWQGDGRAKADWDLAFESRLRAQGRAQRGTARAREDEPRRVNELD